jgi:hypothetical protein
MREKLGKIVLVSLALILLVSAFPIVAATPEEGIKFLVILKKTNGERISAPIAVALQPKYYKLLIEKSNGNGEFYFEVPEAYFAVSLIEWQNWYAYYDACKYAGITYAAEWVKPKYPNVTLAIFGKGALFVVNYTVYIFKTGLKDTYPVEIVLPNDFEPYEIPFLKEQSFFAPINITVINLAYGQKYVPSWWNGTMWISDFGEERIILTPFEYQWYKAKSLLLEKLWRQGLAIVDLKELEEVNWIISHSETYNPVVWGLNANLSLEEMQYYNYILQKIWN